MLTNISKLATHINICGIVQTISSCPSASGEAFRNCHRQRYFTSNWRGIGYSFQLAITAPLYSIIGYCIATAQSWLPKYPNCPYSWAITTLTLLILEMLAPYCLSNTWNILIYFDCVRDNTESWWPHLRNSECQTQSSGVTTAQNVLGHYATNWKL